MRMHSHPALHWTWQILVGVVGTIVLIAGVIMCVTPGPGIGGIIMGLAILATEFPWARRPLRLARRWAVKATDRARRAKRRHLGPHGLLSRFRK
ncbi:PGPGW domain-containing protein [Nocardiopsis rhodophaea]|uniref:PGPGW domain-containing protein n=1 Tax=Nocardiopsis rhodophaea TaxID=280238 RepID=UPI0031CFF7E0